MKTLFKVIFRWGRVSRFFMSSEAIPTLFVGISIQPWMNWLRCCRLSLHNFSKSALFFVMKCMVGIKQELVVGRFAHPGVYFCFVIRVKSVIGIGVGAGAYILTKLAVSKKQRAWVEKGSVSSVSCSNRTDCDGRNYVVWSWIPLLIHSHLFCYTTSCHWPTDGNGTDDCYCYRFSWMSPVWWRV